MLQVRAGAVQLERRARRRFLRAHTRCRIAGAAWRQGGGDVAFAAGDPKGARAEPPTEAASLAGGACVPSPIG